MKSRNPKIDAAVMALLWPDGPDAISPEYLEFLIDEFERRRAGYPRDVARWFADFQGPRRVVYLDMLLAFRPDDMKAVLRDAMYGDEDYGRSAALFLYGHARGLWTASEGELADARELADLPPDEPALDLDELETGMQSIFDAHRGRRKRGTAEDTVAMVKRLHPATVAANKMRSVIGDTAATPENKIGAIRRWLDALEQAGEGALVLEFCVMARIALMKVEARRKSN